MKCFSMKGISLILMSIFLLALPYQADAQRGNAQQRKFDKEAFIAKRNAYVVEKAGLTEEEAAKFIPIFQQLNEAKYKAGEACRKKTRELRQKTNISDKEYLELINCRISVRKKEAELDKEYVEKLRKILSPRKIFLCQEAEMHFAREFMRGHSHNRRSN